MRGSKQITEDKEQFAAFDDLHQDQRNLIVGTCMRAET